MLTEIDETAERAFIDAARDGKPVVGLTHNHYRYPARFSDGFAREAIAAFTRPGDWVLDPHMGGGTTLVEAAAAGRSAVGVDVSSLAAFVSGVKTALLEDGDLAAIAGWAAQISEAPDAGVGQRDDPAWATYRKHLDHPDRQAIGAAIAAALQASGTLPAHLCDFGRCIILRSAQVALDGRRKAMSRADFITLIARHGEQMTSAAKRYRLAVERHETQPDTAILTRSSIGLETDDRLAARSPPRLVLTSPPYPGVHVLYHRWQVGGGRETAAPFWIANRLDGAGSSFYTMGDRRSRDLSTYFTQIQQSLGSVAALCDDETVVVQMLAFGEPVTQLPRYLSAMSEVGLAEAFLPSLVDEGDGRLWRDVPNRRWYSHQRGETPASREVVLFHTLQCDCKTRSRAAAPSYRRSTAHCEHVDA